MIQYNRGMVLDMAEAISNEIREKIVAHKQSGYKENEIAKWLIISKSTVTKVWSKYNKTGSVSPLPKNSGRKPMVDEKTMDKVVHKIEKTPDVKLEDLVEEFELGISISALCRRLIKLGFSYKKRCSIRRDKPKQT
jgi:transposase